MFFLSQYLWEYFLGIIYQNRDFNINKFLREQYKVSLGPNYDFTMIYFPTKYLVMKINEDKTEVQHTEFILLHNKT